MIKESPVYTGLFVFLSMKNYLVLLWVLLGVPSFGQHLSNRIANYTIEVELFPEKKLLEARQVLAWKNTSNKPLTELQFHAYLNAFKDLNSTFMKETNGGRLRDAKFDKSNKINFGYLDFKTFKVLNGPSLMPSLKFIQPDDLNSKDKTVLSVTLPKALLPGQEIKIEIKFDAKLPKLFARTGFDKDYFLVGQWFPKIGVYENNKGWNCHQFHANTEFFADFGVYDVKITAPSKFIVGASGQKQSELNLKKDKTLHHFIAKDVHDFAWTASPNYKVYSIKRKKVDLHFYMLKGHQSQVDRYKLAVLKAMDFYENKIGEYPYSTLSIIDPPTLSSGAAGMEYPTFITTGTVYGMPSSFRFPEIVTVHEFGHQYFQGMLASNEFEESYLDEGFNQYIETRIMDAHFNGAFSVLGYNVSDISLSRESYTGLKNRSIVPIVEKAWEYPKGTYATMSYSKTAIALKSLETYLTTPVMDLALKVYFTRFKFKHPKLEDFIEVVNEVGPRNTNFTYGNNFDWFFNPVFYKSEVLDYSVSIKDELTFEIKKGGSMFLPQQILVSYTDGTKENLISSEEKQIYKVGKSIEKVEILPLMLDINWQNNSASLEKPGYLSFVLRSFYSLQTILMGWF